MRPSYRVVAPVPDARETPVAADGVVSAVLVPARSMYSSASMAFCMRMRLARPATSSKPWPAHCDSQDTCSLRPKNLYGIDTSVPAGVSPAGSCTGQLENDPPPGNSAMSQAMGLPAEPPVCDPAMPVMTL